MIIPLNYPQIMYVPVLLCNSQTISNYGNCLQKHDTNALP